MIINRKWCFFLAIILTISCMAGCKKTIDDTDIVDRVVFGFAQLGDESEWRASNTKDISRAAEAAGVQYMFENAQQKQSNQIKAIRSFILNKVDVIAFAPIVEEGWDNVLMEAKEANIPVILVDRNIITEVEDLYVAWIGSDFEWEGEQAAIWMMKKFKDKEGPIRIAEISGNANSSPTIGRHEGLLKAFGKNSKFEIVVSLSGDFMRSKGRECMENILNETPNIDILYAHNDDMALGAIEIMEERGIVPGKDIIIVSVDAQQIGIDALIAGKINCLVECSPYVGDQLLDLVLKVAKGEAVPPRTITNEHVYTEDDDPNTLPVRP